MVTIFYYAFNNIQSCTFSLITLLNLGINWCFSHVNMIVFTFCSKPQRAP